MGKLSEEIANLSAAQRTILESRLKQRRAQRTDAETIPRRRDRLRARLSFSQQRLWFLDQLEPGNAFYNVPAAFRLQGELDIAVLQRCFDEVVRRHEVLRTSFLTDSDGQPMQIVSPSLKLPIQVTDLRETLREEREAAVKRLASEETRRPFDLTKCPLLRVRMLRLTSDEYVLLCTLHHIISDAWSLGVLAREVAKLYRAFAAGEASPLPELSVQFADFAEWQRQRWEAGRQQQQLAYWKQQLKHAPPQLEMPTDHRRPASQSYKGARQTLTISAELTKDLQSLSREEDVTLFMALLAAWQLLLHRYSGQNDVVVGTDIACRSRIETEGLIGFFVNTLALRTDLSGDPSFRELLRRVRSVCLGAFAHQDMPFDELVDELAPVRSLSRNPIFQVAFTLQNASQRDASLPSLALTEIEVESGRTQFDLSLNLQHGEHGISGWLEYNTDLFEPVTIEQLAAHFQNLVSSIVAHPTGVIAHLSLLSEGETKQILYDWNQTETTACDEKLFHQLFEEQVERSPDKVAVVFEGELLSYRELNVRANRVAWSLIEHGVRGDDVVALLGQRGANLLIGMLAIFKAGAAYVPLDSRHPAERNSRLIEQSSALTVLATDESAASLSRRLTLPPMQVLNLEELAKRGRASNPVSAAAPKSLAYVIYTSGSTGLPKGAMIEHRGMLNHLRAKLFALELNEKDRVAQTASQCFDISVWQYLAPLLVGGCVCILGDEIAHEPANLIREVDRQGITILEVVPSLLRVTLDSTPPSASGDNSLESLRCLIVTGEPVPPELCREWLTDHSRVPLLNAYGPTECSDDVTHYVISVPPPEETVNIPIGRPIINTRLYVLDSHLQPVPCGVSGELLAGGAGVGRGYLGDPVRTAELFVPDPFSTRRGERLYRTGDRVRYLRDGSIEFQGRLDYQVKLRGYRIELGEIEAGLLEQAGVSEAVVVAREGVGGERGLVAYVVAAQGGVGVKAGELRGQLSQRLPEYMVPGAFVVLERLPLTANGKLDRQALPEPEAWRRELAEQYQRPRTPVEEVVSGVWSEVLGMERVGVSDNFFELGGHSLLATQVVSRLRQGLGVELPLRVLFETPTVAGVAAAVQAELAAGRQPAPPIKRADRSQPLPLSFAQQRLWFLQQLEPESYLYNMPLGLRLSGQLDEAALERSLNEVVRRHESLRTSFPSERGRPRQEIGAAGAGVLERRDLRAVAAAEQEVEVRRLMEQQWRRPFDLGRGPVLRVQLVRLAAAEQLLLVTMHHIVADGWSMGVLLREAALLYRAYRRGEEAGLEELPIQYGDYAVWQREWLRDEVLEEQLGYWRQQLAGAPPALELPTDHVRPAVQTTNGAQVSLRVPAELTRQLKELSRRENATLFMVLLAGFQALLQRYTGQQDIVVGTPIAGRTSSEVEGLIGFFINTLVLRTDVSGDPTFAELIARVKQVCLGAYAHQDVPFEKLVEELQPDRDLSHSPLFQVLFDFDAVPPKKYELEGLRLDLVEVVRDTSNFDITLTIEDRGDYLAAALGYKKEIFEAETIERLGRHYELLLRAVCSNPGQRVSQIDILAEQERDQLLTGWNPVPVAYADGKCVPELFEEQAARTPSAVALALNDEQITYSQLNTRANQVAHYLRRKNVGPEVRVGLMFERSLEMVVALLGILKAGGAYAPLDPALPRERLRFMVHDAEIKLVITQKHLLERLKEIPVEGIPLEPLAEELARESGANPPGSATASNLVYVIYTSGSTGVPKGVMVQHSSAINLLTGLDRAVYSIGRTGPLRASVNAPLWFDASVQQLLLLLKGHTLYIVPEDLRTDGPALLSYLERNEIEVFDCTPSQLGLLLGAGLLESEETSPSLILVAGEAMDRQTWQKLGLTGREFFNIYGPTECTVDATAQRVRGAGDIPTIGRPLANTQIFLLDGQMRLTPSGVTGDLYIGGNNLARGYLNRPELTAEKFVPHPFSSIAGARLYHTGDRARYRNGGEIEFLGRLDDQVKLRGFRIELGEIESVLRQHDSVDDVVVLVRKGRQDDQRLVAYVVMRPARLLSSKTLRDHLKARVPEYMIPAAFIFLDRLPLTSSGKVDRNALPEQPPGEAGVAHVAPRTPVEEAIAGIWAEVLSVEEVGAADNFFELGGHSLLATQVVSRIRETLGIDLALRSLFESPTLAGLAACVESAWRAGEGLTPSPIKRVPRKDALPLSFAQERLWFIQHLEPDSAANNIAAGVRLRGKLEVEALELSISEIVRRHEVLRTRFFLSENGPAQRVEEATPVKLAIADLSREPVARRDREIKRIGAEDAEKPFNLSSEPPFRVRLLRLGKEDHILLYTMHHIATDVWSLGIIVREVALLYEAFVNEKPSPLEELPIQYADYAVWQRTWLRGEVLEKQLTYWRGQLEGAPELLELPTDRPRPALQTFRGATDTFLLSQDLSQSLNALCRREGVTPFMLLLAAFAALLYRYSEQEDIVIGTSIANRGRPAAEQLIGCLFNILALRTRPTADLTFREFLRQVRETTLGAYAHQDLPFEKILAMQKLKRDTSRSSLFQVMFLFQNAQKRVLELPGLTMSPVKFESRVARFDLTLFMEEERGRFSGEWEYNLDLFDAYTMTRMLEHWKNLLGEIAAHPDLSLKTFCLASDTERELAYAFNDNLES